MRNYTSAYVKSGGDFDSFNRGLADIAAKHGVSNWESDTNTFIGIGQGLRVAAGQLALRIPGCRCIACACLGTASLPSRERGQRCLRTSLGT